MLGCDAGSELLASLDSSKSMKLAAMGGGASISTSDSDKKNPRPQMVSSQISVANGSGHHRRISFDRELAILKVLFMFDRNQKMLSSGGSGAKHGLHDDTLRCLVIRGYDQFLLGILE